MDCTNARLLLYFAGRDGQEVIAADHKLLDRHLESCAECAAFARAEQQFDQALGRAMNAVSAPIALKTRILDSLALPKKPRYWPWISGAAAALVLAAAGLFFYFQQSPRLDPELALYQHDSKAKNPPEVVAEWFAAEGLSVPVPPQFNYDNLESYDVQVVQGRKLAHLLFSLDRRGMVAHVYVVPAKLVEGRTEPIVGSSYNLVFLAHPQGVERPDHYYMVFISSRSSLESFLK